MNKRGVFFKLFFAVVTVIFCLDTSALANCAVKSYSDACNQCSFRQGGGIDEECQDKHQNAGKACMGLAYPIASTMYFIGNCPALQGCIDGLKACDAVKCPDAAIKDCKSQVCRSCYVAADKCAARAAADCNEEEKCGNGKCLEDKGETKETCCQDCGCPEGLTCKDNACVEKGGGTGGIEPNSGEGDEWNNFVLDLLEDFGCMPFMVGFLLPFSIILAALLRLPSV